MAEIHNDTSYMDTGSRSGGTGATMELTEVAESAVLRQRTADVFHDLVLTARGESGHTWYGHGVPEWGNWEQNFLPYREYIIAIVSASPNLETARETLFRDDELREIALGVAHERCCQESSDRESLAAYELSDALFQTIDDGEGARPHWVDENTWEKLLAEATAANLTDLDCIDEWLAERYIELTWEEGARRHVIECVRGSVSGPSGWIHSIYN